MRYIRELSSLRMRDLSLVGGKNASLGEMLSQLAPLGIRVPDGFAITADAYRCFLENAQLNRVLREALSGATKDADDLVRRSQQIRSAIKAAALPSDLEAEIASAYRGLSLGDIDVAVRSSATAEDLPTASFAGQLESFLNVRGTAQVLLAVKNAFASLFSPRAISYRMDMGFEHEGVALSVGVQRMIRSDQASAGVIFTLDPDTGHRDFVFVTSSYGLGESVVQGRVGPDQFYVHKPTLRAGFPSLVNKKLGNKEVRLIYAEGDNGLVKSIDVPGQERAQWSLPDEDVLSLARWAMMIEEHYSRLHGKETPMDIEWAKDGQTGELFVVQARPETIHSQVKTPTLRIYELSTSTSPILTGVAVGDGVSSGTARVIRNISELRHFREGDILVAETTDPDWEPFMKKARGMITDHGGRTSHAAIVARELGVPAVVGTERATRCIADGCTLTLSCAEGEVGRIYPGIIPHRVQELDPSRLDRPRTKIFLNVGNPEQAIRQSLLPTDGVGLARMEFIFASWVGVHPLALTRYGQLDADEKQAIDERTSGYPTKTAYFLDRLSQGIATIAAAFYPRPVILRFSDFKTNEYARLLGGRRFESAEENPMLGFRGASRYYHPNYKEGFLLEVLAVKRVREDFGLTNLHVMIPFCRTPEEGRRVIETLREGGLERGARGLEVYVMAEIPSNILLAEAFAEYFDGFSIGSNDLTQLTLGVDRDSAIVAPLFDERNAAVQWSCAHLIRAAHLASRKVGICGQAPSDYPDFAAFLVNHGVDSISLAPDAILRTTLLVLEVEKQRAAA